MRLRRAIIAFNANTARARGLYNMKRTFVAVVSLLLAGCGVGMDAEKPHIRDIRVLKQTELKGCEFRGVISDDDMEDLLKKARKVYGNTVVMRDTTDGMYVTADVYRCAGTAGTAPK